MGGGRKPSWKHLLDDYDLDDYNLSETADEYN